MMLSLLTSEKLMKSGLNADASLEELIKEIERLGYEGVILSHSPVGYRCTLTYKGNSYVYKTIPAQSLKESTALALLWGMKPLDPEI